MMMYVYDNRGNFFIFEAYIAIRDTGNSTSTPNPKKKWNMY